MTGPEVAVQASNLIDGYKAQVQHLLDSHQTNALVSDALTRLVASMDADKAVLANI